MADGDPVEKVMVRWQRANNPLTPSEELEKLAADPDPWVRKAAATNPSTWARQRLEEEDPNPIVQDVWARGPSAEITFGWLGPWWTIATAVAFGIAIGGVGAWLLIRELLEAELKGLLGL